jgi:tetratricopeptide (TPR) repeat protein
MKKFILLYFFCNVFQAECQQSVIRGVVSIHNSETETGKRQYVANAQVEDDFKKATSTTTNSNGQFGLVYVGIAEKAAVSFQVIRSGLQVVNIAALSAVAGQQDLVKISMAPPGKVAEYRAKIYQVGKMEAEKGLELLLQKKSKELAALKKNTQANADKVKQLNNDITRIEEQRNKIDEQAKDLARRYAQVNLDDASPLVKNAFRLFKKGELDSAQLLLQHANLSRQVDSLLLEEKKIEQGKKEWQARDSIRGQRKHDIGEALQLKADLHKTHFQFDSADYSFKELIRLDSFNIKYLSEYAFFFHWQNQHDKALAYYTKVLRILVGQRKVNPQTDGVDVAATEVKLGDLYYAKNEFVKAEEAYQEALEITKRLANVNPQTYEPYVAMTQNSLGRLYAAQNNAVKAEEAYQEAVEIRKHLAKVNPQTDEQYVAETLNNLGNLYSTENGAKNDLVKAEEAYLEALEIRKRLAKVNPQTYEPDVAMTQNNLGILYKAKNEFVKAEDAYQEAREIYKSLAKFNPQRYERFVAAIQSNLGVFYSDKKDFVKAEEACQEALEITKRLANVNPQTYDPVVALIQNNLGNLYKAKNDFVKAEEAYQEALEIRKRLAKVNPQTHESYLADTQDNLGVLYSEKNDFRRAEAATLEALEIYKRLIKDSPANLKLVQLLASCYGRRSWYLLFASKFKEAEQSARTGLEVAPTNIWIKAKLAHSLILQGKYEEALKVYQELKTLKKEEGKSYSEICLKDLDALEKAGVTHKDVTKIRDFLKKQ